jgi:transcriptional regulator with GAF, ATPase, and Fis domain
LRLDLAMTVGGHLAPADDEAPGNGADFLTDDEFREREKQNMIAVLRHARGRVWGSDGAAAFLGIKASTFTYRMKALGISKQEAG